MTDTVNWYGQKVSLAVKKAKQESLDALAILGEGKAKINISANGQVDTGFMMNSVYAVTSEGVANEPPEGGTFTNREGNKVSRQNGEIRKSVDEGEAAIAVAAEYAIHQEMKRSFLYRALEQLQEEAGGVIERVGAEELQDD